MTIHACFKDFDNYIYESLKSSKSLSVVSYYAPFGGSVVLSPIVIWSDLFIGKEYDIGL